MKTERFEKKEYVQTNLQTLFGLKFHNLVDDFLVHIGCTCMDGGVGRPWVSRGRREGGVEASDACEGNNCG